jgi:hypothetical protein
VNEAIVSENAEKISEALEKLKNTSMEIGKAIYAQGNSEGDAQPEPEKTEEEKKKEEEEKNK